MGEGSKWGAMLYKVVRASLNDKVALRHRR